MVEELRELCSHLDDKYSVNSGGCMYLAYLIAKNLKKLGIEYSVLMWYDWNDDPYHVSILVENEDTNPLEESFLHGRTDDIGWQSPQWLSKFNHENEVFDWLWKKSYKRKISEAVSKFFSSYSKPVVDSVS